MTLSLRTRLCGPVHMRKACVQVVEGKLGETWKQLTRARMLRFRKPEEQGAQRTLMRVLLLINRMLVFVQRYLHFVTVEVIDPQWHIMMTKIADAASIDEVWPPACVHLHACTRYPLRLDA